MNKKEISEIKKQLTPANCNITRIATCLVTNEKDRIPQAPSAFLSFPEEESFKYFDLFKKSLSGSIGKSLFMVDFPRENHGEKQEFMDKLRKSRLEDTDLLEEFYGIVADSYEYADDYLVVLIHGMYDIPGKASNGEEMFDASDEVYEYIHCILCPVSLAKPALAYNPKQNSVTERIRDKIIEMPMDGFLFPAFNDRAPDLNSILYYSKKPAEPQARFLEEIAGNQRPYSDEEKMEWLKGTLASVSKGGMCNFRQTQGLFEGFAEIGEEEEPTLSPSGIRVLAENAGMDKEQAGAVEEKFQKEMDGEASASGFMDTKSFSVKTPSFQVKICPERAGSVMVKQVEGRLSLVIPLDTNEAEVNGIQALLLDEGN